MRASVSRRSAGRTILALLIGGAAVVGAGPADAAPWGSSGADYDGVLCTVGGTQVPMGSWTVNGTVPAYSTSDITGDGGRQAAAPVSGSQNAMVPGQANFSPADIAAVAYLIDVHGDGSPIDRAEVSADVASVAGSGQAQSRCLGQNGTSAQRAATLLQSARRFAGPYTITVGTPAGAIPGQSVTVSATVRSASGYPTPGLQVAFVAGGSRPAAVTDASGVARGTVVVPAASAVAVTASVSAPTGLTYLATDPPSVAAGATGNAVGTGVLRPVLHPTPSVSISGADLVLSGGTLRPTAEVTETYGYSGIGSVTVLGPVAPASGQPCSTLTPAVLARGPVAATDTFTFRGDSRYRSRPTAALAPGCYGARAAVTITNSSPQARAVSAVAPVTVATLALATTPTHKVAGPGGIAGVVTGTDPGGASVTTSLQVRGPLPPTAGACTGDFASAPIAGTSATKALRATAGTLRAELTLPDVRTGGCYALLTTSTVSLDGASLTITSAPSAALTVAVLRPSIDITTSSSSATKGQPASGSVQVSGTDGFPAVVSVGVVPAETLPITGCRDATFAAAAVPDTTSSVRTSGDAEYRFRTPPTSRNACYAVVARLTLVDNPAVTASAGPPSDATAFLAGVRPTASDATVVQHSGESDIARAAATYGATAIVIMIGCLVLFVRTFRREQLTGRRDMRQWRADRADGTYDLLV